MPSNMNFDANAIADFYFKSKDPGTINRGRLKDAKNFYLQQKERHAEEAARLPKINVGFGQGDNFSTMGGGEGLDELA